MSTKAKIFKNKLEQNCEQIQIFKLHVSDS